MADGMANLAHLIPSGGHLGYHRFQGERHVGAGVAVGNRIHIELVDDVSMQGKGIAEPLHRGPQALSTQTVRRHARDGSYSSLPDSRTIPTSRYPARIPGHWQKEFLCRV